MDKDATMASGRSKFTRHTKIITVTMDEDAALSDAIDLRPFAAGIVIMPSGWTTADLGVKTSSAENGTYAPLADLENSYGTDVSIDAAAASTAYPIPLHVFACAWIKLWSHDGDGGNTTQAAAREFTVILKS